MRAGQTIARAGSSFATWILAAFLFLSPVCSVLIASQSQEIEGLLNDLLLSFSDDQRCVAARRLGKLKEKRAVPLLIKFLNHADNKVRTASAEALGEIGDSSAVEPLLAATNAPLEVRRQIILALGNLKDSRAVPFLTGCLADQDVLLTLIATTALSRLGSSAVDPLLVCLTNINPQVRYGAAAALGKIGDKRALNPLIAHLQDEVESVTWSSARALGDIGDDAAVRPLVRCLEVYDRQLRGDAARSLEKLHYKPATPSAEVTYLLALGKITVESQLSKAGLEPLLDRLEASDGLNDLGVVKALGTLADPAATAPLLFYLERINRRNHDHLSKIDELRLTTEWALTRIGPPAVQELLNHLITGDSRTRSSIVRALGNIGDPSVTNALVAALPDWDVGPTIYSTLVLFHWQPRSEREVLYQKIYRRDTAGLEEDWFQTKRVLLEDIKLGHVEHSIRTFIAIGKEEGITDLTQVLQNHGNKQLAEAYLNCGHPKLRQAAERWAAEHSYTIYTNPGNPGTKWGSWH